MKEPVIVDTACLIGLERIGRLDLLPLLFDPVIVPPEVAREFGLPLPWLRIEPPLNQLLVTSLKMVVDGGEAEAIVLAQEHNSLIVLDDLKARSVARNLGLNLIGLVAVLVRSKLEGLIPELKPLLLLLAANKFRLSEKIKQEALRLVGE